VKKIQAVIFDMDGLLVDSEPIQFEASQLLFRQYGHRFTVKHLKKFLGVRLVEELATLKREWKLQPDVKEFMAKRRNIFLRLIRKKLKLAKGAGELLKFLRQIGLPVGLGTSAEHWYVDEVMKKFNIRHHFDVIVSSEQVQKGKPDPEVYLTVAKHLRVTPANCLVLEDAVNGIAAAKNAGMMCFAVPNPYTPKRDYEKADQSFQSLREVTSALKKLRSSSFGVEGFGKLR